MIKHPPALIDAFVADCDFHDRHELQMNAASGSALQLYLNLAQATPTWVNHLMRARNKLVSWFGIKDLGTLDNLQELDTAKIKVGDRLGIFTLTHLSDNEVILNDTDKHLRVNLSVQKLQQGDEQKIVLTTVVKNHNKFGVLYMFFVKPAHKIIVPALFKRFSKNLSAHS